MHRRAQTHKIVEMLKVVIEPVGGTLIEVAPGTSRKLSRIGIRTAVAAEDEGPTRYRKQYIVTRSVDP